MDSQKFLRLSVDAVVRYYNANDGKARNTLIGVDDVYVVWSCKTLGNNKALLTTAHPHRLKLTRLRQMMQRLC